MMKSVKKLDHSPVIVCSSLYFSSLQGSCPCMISPLCKMKVFNYVTIRISGSWVKYCLIFSSVCPRVLKTLPAVVLLNVLCCLVRGKVTVNSD